MPNPLVAQGQLNRVRGSVTVQNFPALNVSASFLNRAGISLALEGAAAALLPTLTGVVISEEAYMMCTLRINLLKTQPLSALYQAQMVQSSLLGSMTVRPDIIGGGLQPYDLVNMTIASVADQTYNGEDPGWAISCRGYILINNDLWD